MKTREEIVRECAQAATACWNHYSDEPLSRAHQYQLEKVVNETMPEGVTTKEWQEYADEQNRRREEDS